jgi:maltose alpha-D-glucosyltransferase/alpha-amylase
VNGGFSAAAPERLYAPVIKGGTFGYPRLNVQAQLQEPQSLLNWMRSMLQVRRGHPAYGRGSLTLLPATNPAVLAYVRQHENETLLVINNLSGEPQSVDLDLTAYGDASLIDLLHDQSVCGPVGSIQCVELAPYDYRWFELRRSVVTH